MQHPLLDQVATRPFLARAPLPRLLVLLTLWSLPGCYQEYDINTVYGRRHGNGKHSVNGTVVLSNLFEQAGFSVSSWQRLSPRLESEQVIVWVPDSFAAPSAEVIDYLNKWLDAESGRTLIFVGRDFDASIEYWQYLLQRANAADRLEIRRKLAQSKSAHTLARTQAWNATECEWFELDLSRPARQVEAVDGLWGAGLDADKLNVALTTRMTLPKGDDDEWESEVLLASHEDLLAARLRKKYGNHSQIILVTNGSWLLNLPLVNSEHRVLTNRLINECGAANRVCFLESGAGGPRISETDNVLPLMFRMFTVEPINVVLLHLVVLGVVYCFSIFPTFGRPRELPPDRVSDFGKHVTAVGDLLERGGDRQFARNRIEAYHEMMQTKSNKD